MTTCTLLRFLRAPIIQKHTPLIPHCSRKNQLPMLVNLKHLMSVRGTRCYSQLQSVAASSTPQIIPSLPSNTSKHAKDVRYPYFIRRNSRGSLPVYTDIRNGGTRYLISIRNVNGQINSLANELQHSLFKHGSPEANRLKVQVSAQRHVILSGGRWKNDVIDWLMSKGF